MENLGEIKVKYYARLLLTLCELAIVVCVLSGLFNLIGRAVHVREINEEVYFTYLGANVIGSMMMFSYLVYCIMLTLHDDRRVHL